MSAARCTSNFLNAVDPHIQHDSAIKDAATQFK